METRSNFGSRNFGTTKIRNDNEDSYASINLPLTLSPPFGARRYWTGSRQSLASFGWVSRQNVVILAGVGRRSLRRTNYEELHENVFESHRHNACIRGPNAIQVLNLAGVALGRRLFIATAIKISLP